MAILTGCGTLQYASIPGESKAGLVLKHDVSKLLLASASVNSDFAVSNPNCVEQVSAKNIVRTKIVNSRADQGSWKEIWYVQICHKTIPFEISFLPDGSGGTYFNINQVK
ncbi:MAG: hypothetical protein NTU48_01065 [Legionellales bacterium]|nr:hypothetical protein [Legionellales bacterium]